MISRKYIRELIQEVNTNIKMVWSLENTAVVPYIIKLYTYSEQLYSSYSKGENNPNVHPYNGILLLLSHFSHVRLCATPQTTAHQAPPSLGFSRQEHWSGLPFPSPMHESEKWKVKAKLLTKKNKLLIQVTAWVTFKNTMLTEKSQT